METGMDQALAVFVVIGLSALVIATVVAIVLDWRRVKNWPT